MTKKKSTKRIKVMAVVIILSVIVCGIAAVGASAKTRKRTPSTYNIMQADGAVECPYEENSDISKVLGKEDKLFDELKDYADVMSPYSSIDVVSLYLLKAHWVYDENAQIYIIDFEPDYTMPDTYYLRQYNSERYYLKKILNKDNLTSEQIVKIKKFNYSDDFFSKYY